MGRVADTRKRLAEWLWRAELIVLVAAGLAATGVWVFLVIANAVSEEGPGQIDTRILLAMREADDLHKPIGPRWLAEAGRDVTALGGQTVLTLLVASVLGYLVIARRYHAAVFILIATIGGALLSTALKGFYSRPRPDVVPHLAYVNSPSFPSGHAMLSAVVYLTLGALLARLVEGRWAKLYFVCVAVLLTVLVGVSRVYLGVHYPTDVAAGWAAGVGWALLCWLLARYLQHRGLVEKAT